VTGQNRRTRVVWSIAAVVWAACGVVAVLILLNVVSLPRDGDGLGLFAVHFKSRGTGASRDIPAELKAMQFQLQVGTKFGLSATETKYLQGLIQNPSQLRQYINTPP
jgi:hypothetical protein